MTTSPARDSSMRAALRQAAKMGRGGDDRIAHINGYEAAVLKALGGAGTVHPKTGILEFKYGGAGVSEGMNDKEGIFGGGGGFGGGQGGSGFGGGFDAPQYGDGRDTGGNRSGKLAGASDHRAPGAAKPAPYHREMA